MVYLPPHWGGFGGQCRHIWQSHGVSGIYYTIYTPHTTCMGLPARTAEKRPNLVERGSFWGGSPMAVPDRSCLAISQHIFTSKKEHSPIHSMGLPYMLTLTPQTTPIHGVYGSWNEPTTSSRVPRTAAAKSLPTASLAPRSPSWSWMPYHPCVPAPGGRGAGWRRTARGRRPAPQRVSPVSRCGVPESKSSFIRQRSLVSKDAKRTAVLLAFTYS